MPVSPASELYPVPSVVSVALFVHVLGVTAWVGGMAFTHFALRPALTTLEPPQRIALMSAVLPRFFAIVTVSILAVVASGFVLVQSLGGFARVGAAIHAMAGLGLAMVAVYAYVRVVPYVKLRAAVAASKWPDAGAALARIRAAIALNLALGTLTIALATLPR